MQLLTGKPVYTDDVTPSDALVVKILRSPHANAIVQEINTKAAKFSSRRCRYIYLGRCAEESFCDCRSDLSRAIAI